MTTIEELQDNKEIFESDLKTIFKIFGLSRFLKDVLLWISILISLILSIILYFNSNQQLIYINKIKNICFMIVPAMVGLSVAGFAIAMTQFDRNTLEKIADIDDGENSSLYQKTSAVFSVTIFVQVTALLMAVIAEFVMPFSTKVSISYKTANIINSISFFILCQTFLYAIFIIIDLVKNIFACSQTLNFLIILNKILDNK